MAEVDSNDDHDAQLLCLKLRGAQQYHDDTPQRRSFLCFTPSQSMGHYWERGRRPNEGDAGDALGR